MVLRWKIALLFVFIRLSRRMLFKLEIGLFGGFWEFTWHCMAFMADWEAISVLFRGDFKASWVCLLL